MQGDRHGLTGTEHLREDVPGSGYGGGSEWGDGVVTGSGSGAAGRREAAPGESGGG